MEFSFRQFRAGKSFLKTGKISKKGQDEHEHLEECVELFLKMFSVAFLHDLFYSVTGNQL